MLEKKTYTKEEIIGVVDAKDVASVVSDFPDETLFEVTNPDNLKDIEKLFLIKQEPFEIASVGVSFSLLICRMLPVDVMKHSKGGGAFRSKDEEVDEEVDEVVDEIVGEVVDDDRLIVLVTVK